MKRIGTFPLKLIQSIHNLLSKEEKQLVKRKKRLSKEDPFTDVSRVTDNAAIDAEAAEQSGHIRVSAMKKAVDRRLIQIRKAMTRIKLGKYGTCEKCGKMISTDRLMVMPEATVCLQCEKDLEA